MTENNLPDNRETYFVPHGSIVRNIWANSDTILVLFAGAAAEFALNKAVDWLYYTGKLPNDPIGRLFSTVAYARNIVFATETKAYKTIDDIVHIHAHVEQARGAIIPMEAYRDVLYMLIHYSIAAFECMERPMKYKEKEEVYSVFYTMGLRMQIADLPVNYKQWQQSRLAHLQQNLRFSMHSKDLFQRYKKQLGSFRFWVLKTVQAYIVTTEVSMLLEFRKPVLARPILNVYKLCKKLKIDRSIKSVLLPRTYLAQINALDR